MEGWETGLLEYMVVRRTLPRYQERFNAVELNVFGDASGCGIVAAVYTFIHQDSGTKRAGDRLKEGKIQNNLEKNCMKRGVFNFALLQRGSKGGMGLDQLEEYCGGFVRDMA